MGLVKKTGYKSWKSGQSLDVTSLAATENLKLTVGQILGEALKWTMTVVQV